MSLEVFPYSSLQYFASLTESDEHFPLLEAAASLAQDEDSHFDIEQVLSEVDGLLVRIKCRVPADASLLQRLRLLCQYFYRELSFSGNVNNYYDTDNSYVHAVLRTRRGIPITLAVLFIELAQGLGLNAQGVSFPGHFMVKIALPKGQVVMDPFTGQSLSREDLSERLEPYKRHSGLDGDYDIPLGLYLQSASPRDIIARMLRNLQEIYQAHEDWERLLPVLDRLIILQPKTWSPYRDRGLVHAQLSHTALAAQDLETYLDHADDAFDLDVIASRLNQLRRADLDR